MDRTVGNYTNQTERDFPFDCETLEYMATNTQMVAMLGNIAGDKTILYGCTLSGTSRAEGYVFLRTADNPTGEILRWTGGSISSGMHIVNTDVAVGEDYPKAYTTRTLAPGQGSEGDESFTWTDFTVLATTKAIAAELATLRSEVEAITLEPLGVVKMWAGVNIPPHYALCDGSALDSTEYAALYAAIGDTFNSAPSYSGINYSTPLGKFRLPDLRMRFIVGQNESYAGYTEKGMAGGEEKHRLTENEIPSHRHYAASTDELGQSGMAAVRQQYDLVYVQDVNNLGDEGQGTGGIMQTSAYGGNASHENRPPYYVLAYIMKIE